MNLFRFLSSKKGAIKTLPALGISAAAGVAFIYTANFAAHKKIEAERQVRTLSSISQTAPQEGMHRQGGLLTSINVRDGRNELATAQERAAMGANSALERYNANQRALSQMGSYLGRAAEFSESEGLGGGGKEADFVGTYVQGNPTTVDGNAMGALHRAPADQPTGQPASAASGPQLAPASVTRASGSTFGGSAGGSNPGAVAGGIVNSGDSGAPAAARGSRMSGAMPGGTNIVSRMGLDNAQANANFSRGYRDGRVTRGQRITQSQDELKDITKRSAKTAASVNPAANEGAAAFLANNTRSGGVVVEGGNEGSEGSSADLTAPTKHKLKAIGNRLNQVKDEQKERQDAHDALLVQLLCTLVGSVGMIFAGAKILSFWDKKIRNFLLEHPNPTPADIAKWSAYRNIRRLIAAAMIAAVTVANMLLFIKAIEFMNKYGKAGEGVGIAKAAIILSPILVAGMVYTAIKPEAWANFKAQIAQRLKATFDPISMATNSITSGLFK